MSTRNDIDIFQGEAGQGLVKAWTRGVAFDDKAKQQVRRAASMPFIYKWVAVMPDVHAGLGATVGSVIPTKGAIIPAAVLGMITTFNLFNLIYLLSGGGPLRRTEILVTTAYRLVNENRLYGVAAAFSVIIFFVLLILTLATNYVTKATERYDI